MLVLYQAEWCPYSHRVRMRLTELQLEWVARPVPVDGGERDAMEAATGTRSIPTLVDDAAIVSGAAEIIAHLNARHPEPSNARRHEEKLRQEEWTHWVELYGLSPEQP
jgi:glutaredoxin 3